MSHTVCEHGPSEKGSWSSLLEALLELHYVYSRGTAMEPQYGQGSYSEIENEKSPAVNVSDRIAICSNSGSVRDGERRLRTRPLLPMRYLFPGGKLFFQTPPSNRLT